MVYYNMNILYLYTSCQTNSVLSNGFWFVCQFNDHSTIIETLKMCQFVTSFKIYSNIHLVHSFSVSFKQKKLVISEIFNTKVLFNNNYHLSTAGETLNQAHYSVTAFLV